MLFTAFRRLFRAPLFTLVVFLTLGLGVGVNVTVFSVFDFLNRHADAFAEPSGLYLLQGEQKEGGRSDLPVSFSRLAHYMAHQSSFSGIAASDQASYEATGRDEPFQAWGARTNLDYFHTLGVRPIVGRGFTAADAGSATMISEDLWRERFGGDPAVLGTSLVLSGKPHTVIGVVPRLSKYWLGRTQLWLLLPAEPGAAAAADAAGQARFLRVVARLRPGVSPDQARAELAVMHHNYRASFPGNPDADWTSTLDPLAAKLTEHLRSGEFTLAAAVIGVLVLAACNVAGLLFTRFANRRRELAIRLALGASRLGVVRLLAVEGLLLGAGASLFGLGFAYLANRLIPALAADMFPESTVIGLNAASFLLSLGLACATGVLAALVPAVLESFRSPASGIKVGASALAGVILPWEWRLRQAIVALQIAFSLALFIGALLLVASFRKLGKEEVGFADDGVSFGMYYLPPSRYPDPPRCEAFVARICDNLNALGSGVEATAASDLPLTGAEGTTYARPDGGEVPTDRRPRGWVHGFSPGTRAFLRIPLVAGRDFAETDRAGTVPVALVSKRAAERLYPGENCLGRKMLLGTEECEIIGVVGDIRSEHPSKANEAEFYRPLRQKADRYGVIALRGMPPIAAFARLRSTLRDVDPSLPLIRPQLLDYYVSGSIGRQRFLAVLVGTFAVISLVIATVGVGAAVAYAVVQRTREFGVRMALGASTRDVLVHVMRRGMASVTLGLVGGLGLVFLLRKLVGAQLYHVPFLNPLAFALALGGLFLLALGACFFSARQVMRLTPSAALRAT